MTILEYLAEHIGWVWFALGFIYGQVFMGYCMWRADVYIAKKKAKRECP